MRVLLVRPISGKMPVIIPNISLGYLAAALDKDEHEVRILDCASERVEISGFRQRLSELKPGLVGLQMFTCDYTSVKKMAEAARSELPESVIITGGPHPSGLPEKTLKDIPELDFLFFGEAETGFRLLVEKLSGKKEIGFEEIPGLAYREGNEIRLNKRAEAQDISSIPFPHWDLIDPRNYPPAPHGTFTRELPVAPIISSRGCPYNCRYCAVQSTNGRKWRKRDIKELVEEIIMLTRDFGVREIHIEDDNFTLDKERVIEFCEQLDKMNLRIPWALPNGVRLDTLDEELLQKMEKSGCYSFAVGIESSSENFQEVMQRKVTVETIEEKVKLIAKSTKIRMTGFFILGYPGESAEEMRDTIDFACRLPLHRAQFSNFLPLPGSAVYKELAETGVVQPDAINWDDYLDNRIAYSPEGVTPEEMRRIMREGFYRFYFRPGIILGLIREIHSLSQLRIVLWRMADVFR